MTDEMPAPDAEDQDHEQLMDHCALECMNAIESKNKEAFRDSLNVLMAHTLNKMCNGGEV